MSLTASLTFWSSEDAGTCLKVLRGEQARLQRVKDEILANIESDNPVKLDTRQVAEYAEDLRALLAERTFTEQKAFLRSFVKRIEYEPEQVTIGYVIPLPVESNKLALEEVLCIGLNGEPCRDCAWHTNREPIMR